MLAEKHLAGRERKTKSLLSALESWLREKMKTPALRAGEGVCVRPEAVAGTGVLCSDGRAEADNNIAENALRMISVAGVLICILCLLVTVFRSLFANGFR